MKRQLLAGTWTEKEVTAAAIEAYITIILRNEIGTETSLRKRMVIEDVKKDIISIIMERNRMFNKERAESWFNAIYKIYNKDPKRIAEVIANEL